MPARHWHHVGQHGPNAAWRWLAPDEALGPGLVVGHDSTWRPFYGGEVLSVRGSLAEAQAAVQAAHYDRETYERTGSDPQTRTAHEPREGWQYVHGQSPIVHPVTGEVRAPGTPGPSADLGTTADPAWGGTARARRVGDAHGR